MRKREREKDYRQWSHLCLAPRQQRCVSATERPLSCQLKISEHFALKTWCSKCQRQVTIRSFSIDFLSAHEMLGIEEGAGDSVKEEQDLITALKKTYGLVGCEHGK